MSNHTPLDGRPFPERDDLAILIADIETLIADENFDDAADLLDANIAAVWFGMQPARIADVLETLLSNLPSPAPLLIAAHRILTATTMDRLDSRELVSKIDTDDPQQMFVLAMFRMSDLRMQGRAVEALAQSDVLEEQLGRMRFLLDPRGGWRLQSALQIGISAMLAGDFTKALAVFTEIQLHPPTARYAYLTRDALVKSALIHACFGNATTAKAFLERTMRITKTSSWMEAHIDAQQEFVHILTHSGSREEALDQLEAVSLHDIGEMWPFYIVAIFRMLVATGQHDELDHRLEIFDALPFPRVDGDGFSGSIIPLARSLLALRVGRGSEALGFLQRADSELAPTRLIQAAAQLYAGRNEQALQEASSLRHQTRGFRIMEIFRLSIVSTAQYQDGHTSDSIATLKHASMVPRGLARSEVELFNQQLREFAEEHVDTWPTHSDTLSTFLEGLPKPGATLTARESEILGYLEQGHTRAHIANSLFVSPNTVKTQIRSIFRKLNVKSAEDAVREGQRRGLI